MSYVIAEPCASCKDASCVEECPVDVIHWGILDHEGKRYDQFFIDPDECIYCGKCAMVCPVDAIFTEDELPEQWKPYAEINAAFYRKR